MAINLSNISWHQKNNQITTFYNVGASLYTIIFSKSPDNFNNNIKELFTNQTKITIPEDTWKIVVDMHDESTHETGWTISKDSGLTEFATIVEVTQHFETLINPTSMIFVCPNTMFKRSRDKSPPLCP